jgi:hypothetical protein
MQDPATTPTAHGQSETPGPRNNVSRRRAETGWALYRAKISVLDQSNERCLHELEKPSKCRRDACDAPKGRIAEGVGREREECREHKLACDREDDKEDDEGTRVVDEHQQPVHHREQRDNDEGKARAREDEAREPRRSAEHHRNEAEGQDDVEEPLKRLGFFRIWEERLNLRSERPEQESLPEDVRRKEAHQVKELHRKNLRSISVLD